MHYCSAGRPPLFLVRATAPMLRGKIAQLSRIFKNISALTVLLLQMYLYLLSCTILNFLATVSFSFLKFRYF